MEQFLASYGHLGWDQWYDVLETLVKDKRAYIDSARGNFEKFKYVVKDLPEICPRTVDLSSKTVSIGQADQLLPDEKDRLYNGLVNLSPWRKGPFDFFGVHVDSEWQSWMKWERLVPHLPNLKNRKILDIGSATGRHVLHLQRLGYDITAMDISDACGKLMHEMGIDKVIIDDIYNYTDQKYDTISMLMNGIGIAGNLSGLNAILMHLKTIIKRSGQLLIDSSDISYLFTK